MSSAFAPGNLINNSRFYILAGAVLLGIGIACGLRLAIDNTQLWYIRTEQIYGFVSLAAVYVALLLTPIAKLAGKRPWVSLLLFSRRAIGVMAWYFAILHAGVALFGQIGGWPGLGLLPERFVWAIGFGGVALIVLLLMAATSFDRVIAFVGFRRWKWLHRLVYGAGILIILHVWMIGTHSANGVVVGVIFGLLAIFFGLESWRMAGVIAKRFVEFQSRDYFVVLAVSMWLVMTVALACIPALTGNYHRQNHDTAQDGHHGR